MSVSLEASTGLVTNLCTGEIPRPVRQPWCRIRVITVNDEPSMTQASHYDQTDVNAIVERFKRTGQLPVPIATPQYADVTGLQGDLTDLHNRAREHIEIAERFAAGWKPPEALKTTPGEKETVPPASTPPKAPDVP